MSIRLFAPYLGEEELNEIRDSFEKSWVGLGEKVIRFESAFSEYLKCKNSIGVNSATAGLHLAVNAFGFQKGKKVLVPDITFASTAFAPIYNGLDPVFVDVNEDNVSMSIEDLEKKFSKECVAVMPVHYGGHPAEMEKITDFAKQNNLKVVEDCAHTIGASYKGKNLGLWGDVGCFSFEEKKAMTTGDGGMICTNDYEIAERIKAPKWLGIDKDTYKRSSGYISADELDIKHWYYDINELGFKYNMNDLSAAIGLVQLKKLDWMNKRRSEIIREYLDQMKDLKYIKPILPFEPENYSYWLFGIRCSKRDDLIKSLKSKKIATGVHYVPLTQVNYFKQWKSECPVSEKIWNDFVTLPLHVKLSSEEVKTVVDSLYEFEKKNY